MENCIKIIKIPLRIIGFDIFNQSKNKRDRILLVITYISLIFELFCLCYGIAFDNRLDFPDRVYLFGSIQAFIIVIVQLTQFWFLRDKICDIINQIMDLHRERCEAFVNEQSQLEFGKTRKMLYKFCK